MRTPKKIWLKQHKKLNLPFLSFSWLFSSTFSLLFLITSLILVLFPSSFSPLQQLQGAFSIWTLPCCSLFCFLEWMWLTCTQFLSHGADVWRGVMIKLLATCNEWDVHRYFHQTVGRMCSAVLRFYPFSKRCWCSVFCKVW